jgi:hypothetical protein
MNKVLLSDLGLLQHHNTGGNARTIEQVVRQLNNTVDIVIVNQILADFLLCAAAVHHTGEADDRRRSACCKP